MSPDPTEIPSKLKPLAVLVLAGMAGAAAALALNEDLRERVLGSAKALGDEIASSFDSDDRAPSPS